MLIQMDCKSVHVDEQSDLCNCQMSDFQKNEKFLHPLKGI